MCNTLTQRVNTWKYLAFDTREFYLRWSKFLINYNNVQVYTRTARTIVSPLFKTEYTLQLKHMQYLEYITGVHDTGHSTQTTYTTPFRNRAIFPEVQQSKKQRE